MRLIALSRDAIPTVRIGELIDLVRVRGTILATVTGEEGRNHALPFAGNAAPTGSLALNPARLI
jgi:hypothetical protein